LEAETQALHPWGTAIDWRILRAGDSVESRGASASSLGTAIDWRIRREGQRRWDDPKRECFVRETAIDWPMYREGGDPAGRGARVPPEATTPIVEPRVCDGMNFAAFCLTCTIDLYIRPKQDAAPL
jgi:hypothetical protein